MSSFFLLVPTRKCQLARDWLRRERLLDKGGQRQDQRSDMVAAVPIRICEGQLAVGDVLQLLSNHVGVALNEIEIVPRSNSFSGERKVESAHKRIHQICQEVRSSAKFN